MNRFVWLCGVVHLAAALTSTEEGQFYNDAGLSSSNGVYTFTATGIPDHDTGSFPNSWNPNSITAQSYSYSISASPQMLSDGVGCLPMGIVGFARNGVAIFNPYTAEGYNAVEGDNAEQFDLCDGHPTNRGTYHYHMRPLSCLLPILTALEPDADEVFVGIALDGYPIYTTTSGEQTGLDVCSGKTVNGEYRYYTTSEFPYFMGCYSGQVVDNSVINQPSPPGGGNCYFVDTSSPDGFGDLTAGVVNDVVDSSSLNYGDSGATSVRALGLVLAVSLSSSFYMLV